MQTKQNYNIDDIEIINGFMNRFFNKIQKAKVYIKNPSEAPQDVKVEQGPHGGHYYESGVDPTQEKPEASKPQEPLANIVQSNMRLIPRELTVQLNKVAEEVKAGRTSKNLNVDQSGNYKPERIEIHNRIMNRFIGRNSKSQTKTAIMMGGPTASGKSSLLRAKNVDRNQFVSINNDDIKALLPGYIGINAELYHDEARDIADSLLTFALKDGRNVIIDGTMRNLNKEIMKIKMLKERGYRVKVISLNVDPKITIARATKRFIEERRFVPLDHVAKTSDTINAVQKEYQKYADEFELYNTDTFPAKRLI